ncbi:MAG TPA: exodeoxyribonuclease VII large subunit [Burkholderiales bacterium]
METSDAANPAISVSELNRRARELVEGAFPLIWVAGEISNFTRAASGHCYFSLKDATAQVRCVFFRHKAALLDWKPENGMQVDVRALPSFYEARGEFQLGVENMRRSGFGALFEAFERLKKKLQQEGLFEAARKRPIPAFACTVGVVTSRQAAALRDVLTTLARRMPGTRVVIYPAPVQGQGAGARIAQAISMASARAEVDVLILCRGGGSIEDLWAFNEEVVARAIAACSMPVVAGVGHETDFTIADFVADARAPTPTAAAELVSASRAELGPRLQGLGARLARIVGRLLGSREQHLDHLARRLVHPGERIGIQARHLEHLGVRLKSSASRMIEAGAWRVGEMTAALHANRPDIDSLLAGHQETRLRLDVGYARYLELHRIRIHQLGASLGHLNPQAVLERGYSIVAREDGWIVRSALDVNSGERVHVTFGEGAARARIEDVTKPKV